MSRLKIGKIYIGDSNPTYIIAEVGLNHQGDLRLAKKLIDCAVDAQCNAVKFQKRHLPTLYKSDVLKHIEFEEQGSYYILNHLNKTELSEKDVKELYEYANKKNIQFLCTPFDEKSLDFLSSLHLDAYKIGSSDMFNFPLIRKAALTKKPLIISTGMSFLSEIEQLVTFLRLIKAKYILLHCNSTYPAAFSDVNLTFITKMQRKFKCIVGYSGHENGISVSLAAVALGAKVIEKHITLDRSLPGPDHKASLLPEEFKELVQQVRIIEQALEEKPKAPSRGEYLNREVLSKSLVATRELPVDHVITIEDITLKSPGKGTNPLKLPYFVGKKVTKRTIHKDDYILESDVTSGDSKHRIRTPIHHKWGVVARINDLDTLLRCNSSFIELHLTGSDVVRGVVPNTLYKKQLAFHGPEYFDDLLLDLSSLDEKKRYASIHFFNRSLKYARKLKKLFLSESSELVKFVIHPGGMNMNYPLSGKISVLNSNLLDSLSKLDSQGFELLIENMPPLPWYFGGQWYHASFMRSEEIVEFSKKTGYGITFDVSHAALYCNHFNKSLEEYTRTIIHVSKYIHIADADNQNGEGLQIGKGTINFSRILPVLLKKKLWILPEIWQGHKFGGEGFLTAVSELKKLDPEF